MPDYFAHPHWPRPRPRNENTNRIYREYLPKDTVIPDHQPYLTSIAEEINNRPRHRPGYLTSPKHSHDSSPDYLMVFRHLDTAQMEVDLHFADL